jgi:beta-glucosidase
MLINTFKTNKLQFNFPLFFSYDEMIPLKNSLDFLGINYYYRMHTNFRLSIKKFIDLRFKENIKFGNSDLGWETHPKGLLKISKWTKSLNIPLLITENGIAADNDEKRVKYLKAHLKRLNKLLKKEIPILGYFHWAFLDNYEWLEGTAARFGLIHVDYENNYSREIKESGKYYAKYIKSRSPDNFET